MTFVILTSKFLNYFLNEKKFISKPVLEEYFFNLLRDDW